MSKRLGVFIAAVALAIGLAIALTQPSQQAEPAEPPGYAEAKGVGVGARLGAPPAEADWFFNCRHSRHAHVHYLRGKRHTFKDVAAWNKGGRHYHRGTWVTFDIGQEKVTAAERRTYDCTGAG